MITDKPIEPTATEAAIIVAHEVTRDGCVVTVTTFHAPGCRPITRRDTHSAEWSRALANQIIAAQTASARHG